MALECKVDERPHRPGTGWAPGGYLNRCACGSTFSGEKRAWQCADCAYALPGPFDLKAVAEEAAAEQARQLQDLRDRCSEALEWSDTGFLCNGKLRELASTLNEGLQEHTRLAVAERQTAREAMQFVIDNLPLKAS